jgi:hypothetical protein
MSKIYYKSNAQKRPKNAQNGRFWGVLGRFWAFWGVFGRFGAFDAGPASRKKATPIF